MNTTTVKHIVCIEDEPEMIDLIQLILNRRGFNVHGAPGGKEGLDLVREIHPDLVLLDLGLPDMNGWDALTAIRGDDRAAGL